MQHYFYGFQFEERRVFDNVGMDDENAAIVNNEQEDAREPNPIGAEGGVQGGHAAGAEQQTIMRMLRADGTIYEHKWINL